MFNIFHKEAIGVEFHSFSPETTFCFIVVNTLANLNYKGASKCNHHK